MWWFLLIGVWEHLEGCEDRGIEHAATLKDPQTSDAVALWL